MAKITIYKGDIESVVDEEAFEKVYRRQGFTTTPPADRASEPESEEPDEE